MPGIVIPLDQVSAEIARLEEVMRTSAVDSPEFKKARQRVYDLRKRLAWAERDSAVSEGDIRWREKANIETAIDESGFAAFKEQVRAAIGELRKQYGTHSLRIPDDATLRMMFEKWSDRRERQERISIMRAANNGLILSKGGKLARQIEPVKPDRLLSVSAVFALLRGH